MRTRSLIAPLVLCIPRYAITTKAMEEGGKSTGPVRVVEVDGVDACTSANSAARRSGPSFIERKRVESTKRALVESRQLAATFQSS